VRDEEVVVALVYQDYGLTSAVRTLAGHCQIERIAESVLLLPAGYKRQKKHDNRKHGA